MKHLITMICCLFWAVSVRAQDASDALAQLAGFIGQSVQEVHQMAPEDLDFKAHPEKYQNPLTSAVVLLSEASPFSGMRGYGDWTQNRFGKMRLISCHSGIKNMPNQLWGIETELNQGITLHRPDVKITAADTNARVLYPVRYPSQTHKTDSYQGGFFFPILAVAHNTSADLTVSAEMTGQFCSSEQCENETTLMTLPLSAAESYPTPICAALTQSLQTAPLIPTDEADAGVFCSSETECTFQFQFKKAPDFIELQLENDFNFDITQTVLNGEKALIQIKTHEPVAKETLFKINLISSDGIFHFEEQSNATPLFQKDQFPIWGILWSGLLIYFFSPFWIPVKTKKFKSKKEQIVWAKKGSLILTPIILGVNAFWVYVAPDMALIRPWICTALALGFLIYFLRARFDSVFWATIVFILLPWPFMTGTFIKAVNGPGWFSAVFVLLWALCVLAPFYRLFKGHKKSVFVRFPLILLGIWVMISYLIILPLNMRENNLSGLNDKPVLTLTLYEDPTNFTTLWNHVFTLDTGHSKQLQKNGRLMIRKGNIFNGQHPVPSYTFFDGTAQWDISGYPGFMYTHYLDQLERLARTLHPALDTPRHQPTR